ncbi:FkbM family methyltransferase [Roseomonas sp. BN140053]|uniref:FkbM family methyltransferase n=1 Tax=Roseomonas sp. BN140053 TaxID=3391898 RepID=UPI0039EA42E8
MWAYRLLLGREPDGDAALREHLEMAGSVSELRQNFMASPEFQRTARSFVEAPPSTHPHQPWLERFPAWEGPGEPGFFRDFLGVRTRCNYLPPSFHSFAGLVQGADGAPMPLHGREEWGAMFRSLFEARGRLTVVELGAGWGPWLVWGAKAAERLGITEVHLAGVEGAASHYEFLRTHFRDNGLDPERYSLIHGIVGSEDGTAHFPRLHDPSSEWGAEARFDAGDATAPSGAEVDEVRSISLQTLLQPLPVVDILHCDIQGAESFVLPAAMNTLRARVRRIVIGTHGRAIEAGLLDLFAAAGWKLEAEQPCVLAQHGATLSLVDDGVQVWRNTDPAVDLPREDHPGTGR